MSQALKTTLGLIIIIALVLGIFFILAHENVITTDQINEWIQSSWISDQYETLKSWVADLTLPWNN